MIDKGQWGNLARTPGSPLLFEKCHGIFNDHRESGPLFNISSDDRLIVSPREELPENKLFGLL